MLPAGELSIEILLAPILAAIEMIEMFLDSVDRVVAGISTLSETPALARLGALALPGLVGGPEEAVETADVGAGPTASGEVRLVVESERPVRVDDISSDGPLDVEVDVGRSVLGT